MAEFETDNSFLNNFTQSPLENLEKQEKNNENLEKRD